MEESLHCVHPRWFFLFHPFASSITVDPISNANSSKAHSGLHDCVNWFTNGLNWRRFQLNINSAQRTKRFPAVNASNFCQLLPNYHFCTKLFSTIAPRRSKSIIITWPTVFLRPTMPTLLLPSTERGNEVILLVLARNRWLHFLSLDSCDAPDDGRLLNLIKMCKFPFFHQIAAAIIGWIKSSSILKAPRIFAESFAHWPAIDYSLWR